MIRSALKLSPDDFKKIRNEMPTRNAKEREVRDKFHLKSNERAMLEELKEILEAFEFITDELQSNLVNISRVYPGITFLKEKLSINNSVYTNDLREALLASLTKRFEKLLDDDLIVFSTLLDPNFGLDYFETDKQDVVKARLLQKLKRQQLQNQVKK
jgi:dihydropteroate synthase